MTLLQIAIDVAEEADVALPSSVINNSGETERDLLSSINAAGKWLSHQVDWTDLTIEHTFNTADGVVNYDVLAGFQRLVSGTFYDRTNSRIIAGGISNGEWQSIQADTTTTTTDFFRSFRLRRVNNQKTVSITPTPSSIDSLAYEYITDFWTINAAGTVTDLVFNADDDVPLIDAYLVQLEATWRFLRRQRKSFIEEKTTARNELLLRAAQDQPSQTIELNSGGFADVNVPDNGFGS